MVIGWLERDMDRESLSGGAASTWKRVEETQHDPRIPCLLVPQPAHAVLAGDLAAALLPAAFGELPAPIKQAILMHDTGWAMIDAAQIQRLRSAAAPQKPPVSFVANSPQEAVEAWTASINSVEHFSPAGAVVVSRHFSHLATAAVAEHRRFITAEETRRRKLETASAASSGDLVRWTAALGFCDLVSLYLITGLKEPASFPLAHPATPQAHNAQHVTLKFDGHRLSFTPSVFRAGSRAEIDALNHPAPPQGPRAERLSWEIVS